MSPDLIVAAVQVIAALLQRAVAGQLEQREIDTLRDIAEARFTAALDGWRSEPPGPAGRSRAPRKTAGNA